MKTQNCLLCNITEIVLSHQCRTKKSIILNCFSTFISVVSLHKNMLESPNLSKLPFNELFCFKSGTTDNSIVSYHMDNYKTVFVFNVQYMCLAIENTAFTH